MPIFNAYEGCSACFLFVCRLVGLFQTWRQKTSGKDLIFLLLLYRYVFFMSGSSKTWFETFPQILQTLSLCPHLVVTPLIYHVGTEKTADISAAGVLPLPVL